MKAFELCDDSSEQSSAQGENMTLGWETFDHDRGLLGVVLTAEDRSPFDQKVCLWWGGGAGMKNDFELLFFGVRWRLSWAKVVEHATACE